MPARSYMPDAIKKILWNRKHKDAPAGAQFCPDDFLELLLSKLKPSSSVLDLGCGSGNLLAALRNRGWQGHYTGVDISDSVIERTKKVGWPNADWVVSSLDDFPALKADFACFVESLYYARHPEMALQRARECAPVVLVRIVHSGQHADVVELLDKATRHGCVYVLE
ncbi:MAG: class I SAM-dependent methyltransferase [Acidobacteriales bacterium]|nr:class I SAM-dependent methyltransferase [Terriglobales bacterium]